ncbi:MAG TPA: alpha/beta hydrolase [Pseudolabrys sp.]|nr:alpha/beta hydrolase [Pseudolabrys sp.]
MRTRRLSLRAKLVRLGTRYFIKHRSHGLSLAESRIVFRSMEKKTPPPPRATKTVRVDAAGVPADWITRPASRAGRAVLYLHGGGYCLGSPAMYRHFTWRIADAARARVLITDYRLAPEHPFPAALEDAVAAYRWLLQQNPQEMLVMGDSAGGGLTLALLLKLRDEGLRLPDAAVALSPWTDLALTGASLAANAAADPMLDVRELPKVAADYLGGADPRNPYASPLYGDPRGLPPVLIQVGSDEILYDDAARMAEKLRAANPRSELQVWRLMPHVWQAYAPVLPEARAAIADIGRYVAHIVGP